VSRRITAVLVGAAAPLLLTSPAFAALDDGEVPGDSLGTGLVLLYYVVIPLAIFGVLSFLAALPSMLRRPRYRPGRPWKYDPLWFGAPEDPDRAVADARPGASGRGGASAEW
jgi:hypothetical protein